MYTYMKSETKVLKNIDIELLITLNWHHGSLSESHL